MNDQSGPQPQAPGPGGIVLPGRLVLQALALVLGGALGGGGASFLASPGAKIEQVGASLSEELTDLAKRMEQVAVSMVDLRAEVRTSVRDLARLEAEIADLKKRMREIEQRGGRR